MGVMTVTATGAATPELAWRRSYYLQRWTAWAPHLTGVDADTPTLAAGTRGRVEILRIATARFRILRVNPQARTWTWRVRVGPLNLLLDHGLDELPTGTRAWVRIRGPWLILALYRPLMWWALRRLVSATNLGTTLGTDKT
ncbi:SRPBCC family protein [Corynebacterium efficiens]|nr:SRPBCC family protein [Corynebacterium efficiens]